MPIVDGKFFDTQAEANEYLRLKKLKEQFPSLTFDERINEYIKDLNKPEPEKLLSIRERIGMGLFGKIADFFTAMWGSVWSTLTESVGQIMKSITTYLFNLFVGVSATDIRILAEQYLDATLLPEEQKKIIKDEIAKEGVAGSMLGIFAAFTTRLSGIMAFFDATKELERQGVNRTILPTLPDITAVLSAMFRDDQYADKIDDYMERMGFDSDIRQMYKIVANQLLNPQEIKDLFLRGKIGKIDRDRMLLMLGFRKKDLDKIEELYKIIPAPPDIIRFAVREAFSESYVNRYNMLQDLPSEFVEWAQKVGLTRFWAEKYWAAHWELPSIQMAYEMLHRGVINEAELVDLMRAQDVMPFWREKLIQISYSPYTRVDVRRMYREGVIGKDQVYKTYKDLGYDHEHATNLTEFTVKDALQKERDLTKSDLLKAYDLKIMSWEDVRDNLVLIGYGEDEAEIYLQRADLEREQRTKTKQLSFIKRNYIAGLITFDDAHDRLGKLNLKGKEIDELFADWDIEKLGKMQEVSDAKLEELFIEKIITEELYREELTKKGYSTKHIDWLVELTKVKII